MQNAESIELSQKTTELCVSVAVAAAVGELIWETLTKIGGLPGPELAKSNMLKRFESKIAPPFSSKMRGLSGDVWTPTPIWGQCHKTFYGRKLKFS